MAKRRKKSRLTEDERKAIGARLAEARAKAREARIKSNQPKAKIKAKIVHEDAEQGELPPLPRRDRSMPNVVNHWRAAALAMLRAVRHQVFQVCTCKSKAYLNRCERYSCRHLLDAVKHIDALAVKEGALPPMRLMQPRFDNHGTPQFRSDRPLREQHTVSIDPEARQFDESGMPLTPAGRGQGLQDFGPSTFEVKIGS